MAGNKVVTKSSKEILIYDDFGNVIRKHTYESVEVSEVFDISQGRSVSPEYTFLKGGHDTIGEGCYRKSCCSCKE